MSSSWGAEGCPYMVLILSSLIRVNGLLIAVYTVPWALLGSSPCQHAIVNRVRAVWGRYYRVRAVSVGEIYRGVLDLSGSHEKGRE